MKWLRGSAWIPSRDGHSRRAKKEKAEEKNAEARHAGEKNGARAAQVQARAFPCASVRRIERETPRRARSSADFATIRAEQSTRARREFETHAKNLESDARPFAYNR